MKRRGKPLLRKILILLNIMTIVGYLSTVLIPFINPGNFWPIAFLGLGFPFIVLALLIFIILWFILKSKWWLISLVVLLIGFQQIKAVFSFHLNKDFVLQKVPNTLRILQYNVMGAESIRQARISGKKFSPIKVLNLIKKINPDILTFQEFYTSLDPTNSTIAIISSLGYPYHYFAPSEHKEKKHYLGVAIFSKYPITDSATIVYNQLARAEPLISVDIKVLDNTYRIFTTHLQSIGINRNEYKSLNPEEYGENIEMKVDRSIASKLKYAYELRYSQSQIVREAIKNSPYPVIMCGDFNDVPNSSTYFMIKGNLKDAFLKKGSFIGRSFRYISPNLRIDYILADPLFKINQFTIPHLDFSDHFPIVADLEY